MNNEWERTKDPRPIAPQAIDKTMVKSGDVIKNWKLEMGDCIKKKKSRLPEYGKTREVNKNNLLGEQFFIVCPQKEENH